MSVATIVIHADRTVNVNWGGQDDELFTPPNKRELLRWLREMTDFHLKKNRQLHIILEGR